MARNQNRVVMPGKQNIPQTPMNTEGTGGEGGDNIPDSNANTADQTGIPQTPVNTEGASGEGGDNTPDSNANTADQTGITQTPMNTVPYIAKRPLLHNKKTYAIDADVTGLFEGEELERLLKLGAIAKV